MYRPPSGGFKEFVLFLEGLLSYATEENLDLVLGGDLNINMLTTSQFTKELDSVITANGFHNVITKPTRVTQESVSLIDVFITNYNVQQLLADTIYTDISDHLGIFMLVSKSNHRSRNVSPVIYTQPFTNEQLQSFRAAVSSETWNCVYESDTSDVAYSTFIDTFKIIYDANFPFN